MSYSPAFWKIYNKYKRQTIVKIEVLRTPVPKLYDTLLNILSLGSWNSLKTQHGYEEFHHLCLILYLQSGVKLLYEKNAIVSLTVLNQIPKGERMPVRLDNPISLEDLIRKTETFMGPDLYTYTALPVNGPVNNCQTFVFSILKSNKLLTPELASFIDQKTQQIVSETPTFLNKLTKTITDLGGSLNYAYDTVKTGLGFRKGGKVFRNL